jgi:enolase
MGMDASNQAAADQAILNICPNAKIELGGNAVAACSAAVLKAGAASLDIPLYQHIGGVSAMYLPVPGVLALDGSDRYGGGVTTPGGKPSHSFMMYGFKSFAEASYAGWEINKLWGEELKKVYYAVQNHLGAYTIPPELFESDLEIWDLMSKAIDKAGYSGKVGIQIDCAADTYYDRSKKIYRGLFKKQEMDRDALMEFYKKATKELPIVILEDPFWEDDYESHAVLTREVDIQIVGDDLFTTNPERVVNGIKQGAANTVLLKVNQVGTISEALEMVQLAYKYGYGVMPCDSRGEGAAMPDYAVGINAGSVREMAIGERGNRFLEIEEELGSRARFWGYRGLKGNRFLNNASK